MGKIAQPLAILFAFAGFTGWVVLDVAIKLASEHSLSPFAIMAVTGLASAGGILANALFRRDLAALRPKRWRGVAFLALAAVSINFFSVVALKHLPFTMYYILAFTAPIMIVLLTSFLKHETPNALKTLCILAGFAGVVIAVFPFGKDGMIGGDSVGYIASALCTFSYALSQVFVRRVTQSESVKSLLFLNGLAVGVFGLIFSLPELSTAMTGSLAMLAGAGLVNLASNALNSLALRHAAATTVAQFQYTQLVSGAFLGFLIWHEVPTANLIAGSILIVAAGLVVAAHIRKSDLATSPHDL